MAPRLWPDTPLGSILHTLEVQHGVQTPAPFTSPFEMIVWEIVAYLVDDDQRAIAFEALRNQVGITPEKILSAPKKLLREITRTGGAIATEERAERLVAAARMVLEDFDGDLSRVLELPPQKAKKLLMQFPMVGEPGAEKILVFTGALGVLPLESNGLRVLVRLGFGAERKSYAATYRSVREITLEQLPLKSAQLASAHLLLRRHGRELCFRSGPLCAACPVSAQCPSSGSL